MGEALIKEIVFASIDDIIEQSRREAKGAVRRY